MGLYRKTTALPPLSREEALACIPVRNHAIQASQTPEGMVRLRYPLILKPWIAELAQRFRKAPYTPPSRQLELDELGILTWLFRLPRDYVPSVLAAGGGGDDGEDDESDEGEGEEEGESQDDTEEEG